MLQNGPFPTNLSAFRGGDMEGRRYFYVNSRSYLRERSKFGTFLNTHPLPHLIIPLNIFYSP